MDIKPMEAVVGRGYSKLLTLEGEKQYHIQAHVRTVTICMPGEKQETLIDSDLGTLHFEFLSHKVPNAVLDEVKMFLNGFEIANVRVDIKKRISHEIAVATFRRVDGTVDLMVYTPNRGGWYFEGQLDLHYLSLYSKLYGGLLKPPYTVAWGNKG